jgi:hypothetical protein
MSFSEYAASGWKLCGIEPGRKSPTYKGWNDNPIADDALDGLDGAGLLHALSGTAALDIDDLETARPWLAERGVDVDALVAAPNAVMISSGRDNRAKLLYRMKRPLRTLKPKDSGIELRCATADGKSVQDVLPPTIHPDTRKPYAWKYGDPLVAHWSAPPPIPPSLLALWRELLAMSATQFEANPETAPSGALSPVETVRKAIYQHIHRNKVDITDYNQWLDVGARLHEATNGSQEGLDIWDEWSRTDTSMRKNGAPRYEGKEAIEVHYKSFHAGRQGNVSLDGQIAQLPAEKDEFEVENSSDESVEDSTAEKLKKQATARKADATAKLEARLVFVYAAERYFDTQRRRVINTDGALEHMFTHMMPRKKGGKKESPVQILKESSTKRYVDKVGFHPGEGAIFRDREDYSYANTYDGSRIPAPLEPTGEELDRIEWLFNRIDDPAYRIWLKQFYGHVVQRPGVKIRSAPLIWSAEEGNGKTTLVRMIPSLLVGPAFSKEITHNQLEDGFTGYLADTWHVNLTEFRASSRNEREAISKKVESWIADDVVTVRPMHQVAYSMPNHFFLTASSNFDDAASISNQNRKWAIHELKAPQFTEDEQRWIYDEFLLTPRAAGVLRHYFLAVDLAGFTASAKAIQTEARREMIEASASTDIEAMANAFDERSGPFVRDVVLVAEVTEWARKAGNFKPSMHRVGKLLAKPPFGGKAKRFRVGPGLFHGVIIRNHAKWDAAPGKEIMDHIQGADDGDLGVEEFVDETVDLLA